MPSSYFLKREHLTTVIHTVVTNNFLQYDTQVLLRSSIRFLINNTSIIIRCLKITTYTFLIYVYLYMCVHLTIEAQYCYIYFHIRAHKYWSKRNSRKTFIYNIVHCTINVVASTLTLLSNIMSIIFANIIVACLKTPTYVCTVIHVYTKTFLHSERIDNIIQYSHDFYNGFYKAISGDFYINMYRIVTVIPVHTSSY